MCWASETLKKRIATEDIKVFKVVDIIGGKLRSYYYSYRYDFNQPYRTYVKPVFYPDQPRIFNGFHSYNPKKCKYVKDKITGEWHVKCGRIYLDTLNCDCHIVECTIPKHSEYYENEYGEIVSNQIIINKIIE